VSRNPSDQVKLVEEALCMAKEAVAMDTSDGLSWSVLGNSHLAAFFNIAQNPVTLKQCMSAYHQAVSCFHFDIFEFMYSLNIIFYFIRRKIQLQGAQQICITIKEW